MFVFSLACLCCSLSSISEEECVAKIINFQNLIDPPCPQHVAIPEQKYNFEISKYLFFTFETFPNTVTLDLNIVTFS